MRFPPGHPTDAIQSIASEVGAPLVPMAVSTYLDQDRRTTWPLVRGYRGVVPMLGRYKFRTRSRFPCIHMHLGSDRRLPHRGVALPQGIPAICLSASSYYDHKFAGLEQMFEPE